MHIGMSLKMTVGLSEGLEILYGEKSAQRKRRIKRGSRVSLGKNQSVSVRPSGIVGVDVHLPAEIKPCKHISNREGSTRMAAACRVRGLHNSYTDLAGNFG